MDIPAHVWEAFEAFAKRHLGDFYCELKLGLPDELTPRDDRCIINPADSERHMARGAYVLRLEHPRARQGPPSVP